VLAFEMIIDCRLVDASSVNDVSNAGILEAFLRKQVNGGFDYILTGVLSWTGHAFPFQTTV
ncbi:MAG: hypothetical protein WCC50_11645, partial [Pseudolabrys sp.]